MTKLIFETIYSRMKESKLQFETMYSRMNQSNVVEESF